MGKSSSASLGECSHSSTLSKNAKHPGALTANPNFAHLLYVLTAYRYVLLCLLFGLISVIAGVSLLLLSLVFRWKTASIHLLESVPLYMPGLILLCNGISMIAFMNKHTRRLYLLKSVCGLFLLVALLLIIVSVTTSVIHLPRLSSHRECAYTQRLRACTCVQNAAASSSASKHFIMEEIDNCELVHSVIYDSLRGVFAVALISILASIFSIMTLYQLYIHEKQKVYFNELNNLRQRIHQRNVLQSLDHGDSQSVYLSHFNHLYSADGTTNESAYTQCLSPRFSSQDLLLDQSSTNFGVSKPNREQSSLSSRSRIWSSQSSNLVHNGENRSESVNFANAKNPDTAFMRRYMSAIFDGSNNVQSYVRQKLNSFRRINTLASDRLNKRGYHRSQNQFRPPHVTILRHSMGHASVDSSNGNYPMDRAYNEQMRKSVSVHSASSSSHKSTSTSASGVKSKQQQLLQQHSQLLNAQTEHAHIHQENASTSLKDRSKRNIQQFEPSTHQSGPYSQQSNEASDAVAKMGYDAYQHWQMEPPLANVYWSHSNMMDTFRCIDEDDLANSEHFGRQPSHLAQLALHNDTSLLMENKPLHCTTDAETQNESQKTSPEEMPSSTRFTFGSQPDNRSNMTAFEEAFQNYYNSQHRISNQQYFTLPIKSVKERAKRKGHHSKPAKSIENRIETAKAAMRESSATVIFHEQIYPKQAKDDGKDDENRMDAPYLSEDEFPAIEPPADYKNAINIEEMIPVNSDPKTRTMESLTNQLLQPYQFWVQQFMEQMNQNERMEMEPEMNQTSIEFDTVANEGFIDDDDAGDTSTSQDLADFELDLDEESIKFISDDESHKPNKTQQEVTQEAQTGKPAIQQNAPTVPTNPFTLLKKNTDLIKRTVLLNKATDDDYRFDGFRKDCFDDDEDETSSAQSSLSNGTESSDNNTNSITAEFVKPPTPFTNYYVNS